MRRTIALLVALLASTGLVAVDARADETESVTHEKIASFDGTEIAITIFEPVGVGPERTVPVVLDSHGWGGSRRTTIDGTVRPFLDAGYGMVSIDQRGHGDSGGQANVQDPDIEAQDIIAVIDRVAALDWVALEAPGDPIMGAIGGSYGGGYQLMTALVEQSSRDGGTRFDVLAPEITWHDLPDSLAPADVPRTAWLTALYAAGAPMLPQYVHEAFVEGVATGRLPQSIKDEFATHSPRWFTDAGVRLDIPVLIRQGTSDNLFNLNQALRNFDALLTDRARTRSALVAYNGGHALPNVLPMGSFEGSVAGEHDACSTSAGHAAWSALRLDFFDRAVRDRGPIKKTLPAPYNLTTADGSRCVHLARVDQRTDVPVGTAVTTAGAGAPKYVPLLTGPATVAGIPRLRASLTTIGVDSRAFFGLAVGTTPLDATVVQNNVLPVNRPLPVIGERTTIELPGVAVDVAEGETLYLMVSPVSDMFFAHGSRTPGVVLLEDAVVELPLVTG